MRPPITLYKIISIPSTTILYLKLIIPWIWARLLHVYILKRWAFLVAHLVKNLQCRRPPFNSWIKKIPWRRDRLPTPVFLGFPGGSEGKESACNAGDLGWIPGLGRSPGGGHGNLLHYSCLKNPHGKRRLVGYSPWGCKELDMTERLSTHSTGDAMYNMIK